LLASGLLAVTLAAPGRAQAGQDAQGLLDAARQLHAQGHWREAVSAYLEVAAVAREREPALAAVALNNACDALNSLGDYRTASQRCGEALALRRALGDELRLARTLNNLGVSQQYLGLLDAAQESFGEALAINRRHGDARGEGINLANLGLVAMAGERYGEAMARFEAAAHLAQAHAEQPWASGQESVAAINQGVVLERVGSFRQALVRYRAVADRLAEADPWRRAALELNIGVVYRNLGDPVRAVESFRAAAETYARLGDSASRANALLNLGLALHLNLDRSAEGEQALSAALAAAVEAGDRALETDCRIALGELRLQAGQAVQADALLARAAQLARDSGADNRLGLALHGLARIEEERGDLEAAWTLLQQAMTAIEQVRSDLATGDRSTGDLRADYSGSQRRVYASAVRVLAALDAAGRGAGRGAQALQVVQRAKARELVEALRGNARTVSGAAEGRPREALALPSLPLRDGAVMLEYFVGSGELYGWRLDSELHFVPLGESAPILAAAGRLHGALSAGEPPPAEELRLLSQTLVRSLLPGTGGAGALRPGELLIAADGLLRYLPFELLADPAAPDQPLVERMSISYLPSASAAAWLPYRRGAGAATLLALGDPALPTAGDRLARGALLVDRFALARLPAARRELPAIARQLGGSATLLLDAQASEAELRRRLPAGSRVVHLATHTVVDERPGRGAAILLAAGGGEDGVLSPQEIAGLSWPAELTVLASCRSALGAREGGGALGSLTGALLAAGSSGVIASLWEVDDDATALFMEQLYYRLGRGERPARALAEVKRTLRTRPGWDRPALWSAFVLVGDPPPVAPGGWRLRWAGLAALAGALSAAWAVVLWLRRRRARERRPTSR
jgi:tetratricopeptide (TPR) repeat protein